MENSQGVIMEDLKTHLLKLKVEEQKELEKSEEEEEEEDDRKSEDDKEEEERKCQEEMEHQHWERRYILPDELAIIVHPNWAAKSGKFDCSIMSLSVLLDYRLEDNKECSFEVSLFEELFNEMLQRDFGVRIYKSLLSPPEKEDKKEKDKKSKKGERKDKEQTITINRDLLMSFVYFDQSHCSYLLEKDLEEILYTLGLHLSRAQVKKLLNKVVLHESCFYQKLTDTSKDEENHEESESFQEEMIGNRLLLPTPTVKQELKDIEENVRIIVYNGAMIDVGSLLQKLEKSDKVRAEKVRTEATITRRKSRCRSENNIKFGNFQQKPLCELREIEKDLSQLQENLKVSKNMNLQFENQLNKTVRDLYTVMDEIHSVLKKDNTKTEDKDEKAKENDANV
ncbi:Cell division cycle and apoptosis regulator protein 1 [Heterocephalus glaber]|uniref:Cell division cycle and apoptosis regulator protein 1 n=1 Tax=Heterocephalus glaber TaxID=10181 RepID=G5BWD8_HETGA|nr:Cell division cycle and apoptosis regulator protein 1 [Heterocephalus glaber]